MWWASFLDPNGMDADKAKLQAADQRGKNRNSGGQLTAPTRQAGGQGAPGLMQSLGQHNNPSSPNYSGMGGLVPQSQQPYGQGQGVFPTQQQPSSASSNGGAVPQNQQAYGQGQGVYPASSTQSGGDAPQSGTSTAQAGTSSTQGQSGQSNQGSGQMLGMMTQLAGTAAQGQPSMQAPQLQRPGFSPIQAQQVAQRPRTVGGMLGNPSWYQRSM